MAAFEFDFVAEELGFSIAPVDDKGVEVERDPETLERLRIEQTNRFLLTGKITPLARGKAERRKLSRKEEAEERALAQRCQIIAETVVEVMALKGRLQSDSPKALDQSL